MYMTLTHMLYTPHQISLKFVGLIFLHRFGAKLCGLVCGGLGNMRVRPNPGMRDLPRSYLEWFKVRSMRNEIKEIGLPSVLLICVVECGRHVYVGL